MKIDCSYDEIVSIDSLKTNPANNNTHSEEQVQRLAEIIDYQGMRSPIVVSNRSGLMTKGHCRLEAIILLGWTEAPVDYQDYEDEAQELADMTADNEIARWAVLDNDALMDKLKAVKLDDIKMLGIKDFALPVKQDAHCGGDEVPEVIHDPVTKRGDVWLMGNHRVMCGDSLLVDDVEKLMNKNTVNMVFTDPPYGYKYESNYQDSHKMLKNDDKILDFLPVCNIFMKDNATIYVFTSHQVIDKWKPLFEKVFDYKNTIVWKKNNWSMGDLEGSFAGQHELIMFGSKGKNKIIGKRDGDVWSFNRVPPENHPTIKPIDLTEFALEKWQSGEVLDLFIGSGSTLIACEKTNRKCYGMEIDEHYCDVTIERYMKYTGRNDCTLESTGETYDELKKKKDKKTKKRK